MLKSLQQNKSVSSTHMLFLSEAGNCLVIDTIILLIAMLEVISTITRLILCKTKSDVNNGKSDLTFNIIYESNNKNCDDAADHDDEECKKL